ncbi:MAG TPA: hypothetical protein VNI52_14445 [Sphingobacteriaceae bacterium]|nr:hypothetical protein [Sphingobacteriaceae bacterium]
MKYKALFLLAVFLLHQAVGLACALHGPKAGELIVVLENQFKINYSLAADSKYVAPHEHAEGTPPHSHNSHKHTAPVEQVSEPSSPLTASTDSGSSQDHADEDVNKVTTPTKLIPKKGNDIKIPVFTVGFYDQNIYALGSVISKATKAVLIPYKEPPPKPDIRISIHSFLI